MFPEKGRHAEGSFLFANNGYFEFEGPTEANMPHGCGTLHLHDGSSLTGTFTRGALSGQGVRRWENGSIYCGAFSHGEYHGLGRLVDAAKGLDLEGEFCFGQLKGQGTLNDSRLRRQYRGEFEGNLFHGHGVLETVSSNGGKNVVEGDFKNGQPHGHVTWRYANGDTYIGEALEGKPHGSGQLMHCESGTTYTGPMMRGTCAAIATGIAVSSVKLVHVPAANDDNDMDEVNLLPTSLGEDGTWFTSVPARSVIVIEVQLGHRETSTELRMPPAKSEKERKPNKSDKGAASQQQQQPTEHKTYRFAPLPHESGREVTLHAFSLPPQPLLPPLVTLPPSGGGLESLHVAAQPTYVLSSAKSKVQTASSTMEHGKARFEISFPAAGDFIVQFKVVGLTVACGVDQKCGLLAFPECFLPVKVR